MTIEYQEGESPRIKLPEGKRAEVENLVAECRLELSKIDHDPDLFRAPEQLMHPDTRNFMKLYQYKIALAEKLLQDGEISTWEVSRELLKQVAPDPALDADEFGRACQELCDVVNT